MRLPQLQKEMPVRVASVLITLGFSGILAVPLASMADSADARCDIYPAGEDRTSAVVNCTFSQYQGNVYIDRADGVRYAFTPTGEAPGNFVDESGRAVYRQSGLGSAGLIFRTPDESVYVYWGASAPGQGDATDSPTAPYATAEYDATTWLPCSVGEASHDQNCPAGILRGDGGSASIRVTAADGSERVLNFKGDDVTTPDGGDLTWGKQGDEWYIGIDDREFYVVPEAAVYGG